MAKKNHKKWQIFKKKRQNLTGFKKYITKEELKIILNSFKNTTEYHYFIISLCLAFLGLRISEVVKIRIFDFTDDFNIINVFQQKNKKMLTRRICKPLRDILMDYIKKNHFRMVEGYIFPPTRSNNKHLKAHSFETAFSRRVKKLGIGNIYYDYGYRKLNRISCHTLRHFFVTNLLNQTNGNITLVSQIVGHSKVQTTFQYFFDPTAIGIENKLVNETFNKYFENGLILDPIQKNLFEY